MRGNPKSAVFVLALFSVFSVIALYYNQNSFLEAFEARTYDLRFMSLRGAVPPSADIAIVAIDDKSIAELGRHPWTRSHYVRLLERLSAADAKALLWMHFFPKAK
ncbi:MAG: CHASE2 domain-containing protein, partial [Gallionella sp.]|nr:CHASE2 domain-containing protein [Gallionella sp.]